MASAAPTNPEAAIDAALAAREAGRGEDAARLLRSALALHPDNARLWQTLGTTLRWLEQSASAIAAFERAARLAPSDVKPAHGIAQSSLEAGRPASALFEQARRLAPSDGSLVLGWAAARMAEGHAQEAIAALDAIVHANPVWLEGQATLARLRWQMGDSEFAAGYEQAVLANAAALPLWLGFIDLLVHSGSLARARAVIGRARVATGADAEFWLMDAICASELGDVAAADALFCRLEESSDVAVAEQHVRHLLRTGRAAAAAARAEPLLARPDAARLWPYIALAWRIQQDPRYDWLEGDPSLIGVYDLENADEFLPPLAARLRALHQARRDPLGQSVRSGTQTDGPLFSHEATEIQALRARLVETISRHIATLGRRDVAHPTLRHIGKPFRFAGSWSVRLTDAGHHTNHVHPQGWLSSALYVAVPPQAEMGHAPAGWLQLGAPPVELGLRLPPIRQVEPKPGRLVLFPSTLWHGTLAFEKGERLTVAFDVAAIG